MREISTLVGHGPHGKHHHGKHGDHCKCPITIQYINALYCIELLRRVNVTNIDSMITWQYGKQYGAAWTEYDSLRERFKSIHPELLWQYLNLRCMAVVDKLLKGLPQLTTDAYIGTPMEPRVYDSILSSLDMLTDTDFQERIMDEFVVRLNFNYDNVASHPIHNVSSNFMEFEVADRILCGVFDNFVTLNKQLSTEHFKEEYGRQRIQILDNRFPMCLKMLEHCYQLQCRKLSGLNNRQRDTLLYDNFGQWASIFSIFYRLVTPCQLHPKRLEAYYQDNILHHPLAAKAIGWARQFSMLPAEDVIDAQLPQLCPKMITDAIGHHTHMNVVRNPDGIVERYLVTQYLVEKASPADEWFV